MKSDYIKLESGKEYTLAQLFSGKNKIIIPDLQRDYCWGGKAWDENSSTYKELVSGFLLNLLAIFRKNKDEYLTLGLIYGYENPRYHIQLCDGQQRITTLYLLLGILNRKTDDNRFQEYLISDEEYFNDDKETYLQYSIRESTLYFLSDLVCNFFLNKNVETSEIKKQKWYFQEYDLDSSIESMLSAIETIEKKLSIEDYLDFGDFIINKIQMIYYDMGNRTRGEETFVVINTTGEPLSATENLKPIFLGSLDDVIEIPEFNNKTKLKHYSDMWEKWEQYFWENRHGYETSDIRLKEFFRWIYIIESTKIEDQLSSEKTKYKPSQLALAGYPYDFCEILEENDVPSTMNLIDNYFEAVRFVFSDRKIRDEFKFNQDKMLSQIDCFRLLPIVTYIVSFNQDQNNRNLDRIKNFYFNISLIENVRKSSVTTVIEAIRLIKLLKKYDLKDIADITNIEERVSDSVLSKEEIFKFNVYKNNPQSREQYEDSFWKAEKSKCCKGRIGYLFEIIDIDIGSNNYQVNLVHFDNIKAILKLTIEEPSDLMRRALLTYGDYSLWNGTTYLEDSTKYSLGNDSEFFKFIMQELNDERIERKIVKNFLSDIFLNLLTIDRDSVDSFFNSRIKSYEIKSQSDSILPAEVTYGFVKDSSYLEYMKKKLYCITGKKEKVYILQSINITKNPNSRKVLWEKENNSINAES